MAGNLWFHEEADRQIASKFSEWGVTLLWGLVGLGLGWNGGLVVLGVSAAVAIVARLVGLHPEPWRWVRWSAPRAFVWSLTVFAVAGFTIAYRQNSRIAAMEGSESKRVVTIDSLFRATGRLDSLLGVERQRHASPQMGTIDREARERAAAREQLNVFIRQGNAMWAQLRRMVKETPLANTEPFRDLAQDYTNWSLAILVYADTTKVLGPAYASEWSSVEGREAPLHVKDLQWQSFLEPAFYEHIKKLTEWVQRLDG